MSPTRRFCDQNQNQVSWITLLSLYALISPASPFDCTRSLWWIRIFTYSFNWPDKWRHFLLSPWEISQDKGLVSTKKIWAGCNLSHGPHRQLGWFRLPQWELSADTAVHEHRGPTRRLREPTCPLHGSVQPSARSVHRLLSLHLLTLLRTLLLWFWQHCTTSRLRWGHNRSTSWLLLLCPSCLHPCPVTGLTCAWVGIPKRSYLIRAHCLHHVHYANIRNGMNCSAAVRYKI